MMDDSNSPKRLRLSEENVNSTEVKIESADPSISEYFLKRGFCIKRIIGSGGSGIVFHVEHDLDKQHYAIKAVKLPTKESEKRALEEAQTLARIYNPGIVQYHGSWRDTIPEKMFSRESLIDIPLVARLDSRDVYDRSTPPFQIFDTPNHEEGADPNYLFIQMELCRDYTLKEWIDLNGDRNDVQKLQIALQIVEALEVVHNEKLIHRDLKPRNIFFDNKDGKKVKIGDFGLVTGYEYNSQTLSFNGGQNDLPRKSPRASTYVGTKGHMAPEIIDGKEYSKKVDIYSLGLILFNLMRPYRNGEEQKRELSEARERKFPSSFEKKYPSMFSLINRLLDKDPDKRLTAEKISGRIRKQLEKARGGGRKRKAPKKLKQLKPTSQNNITRGASNPQALSSKSNNHQ